MVESRVCVFMGIPLTRHLPSSVFLHLECMKEQGMWSSACQKVVPYYLVRKEGNAGGMVGLLHYAPVQIVPIFILAALKTCPCPSRRADLIIACMSNTGEQASNVTRSAEYGAKHSLQAAAF